MNQRYLGIVLLVLAQVLLGGWAFAEMLRPANLMQVLRAFAMC